MSIRTGVAVEEQDLAFTEIKSVGDDRRSAFVRFHDLDLRMTVWSRRQFAKKNSLYMEEWLTGKDHQYRNLADIKRYSIQRKTLPSL